MKGRGKKSEDDSIPGKGLTEDEIIAWRLHRELNAESLLRTRSRKAVSGTETQPDNPPSQQQAGCGGADAQPKKKAKAKGRPTEEDSSNRIEIIVEPPPPSGHPGPKILSNLIDTIADAPDIAKEEWKIEEKMTCAPLIDDASDAAVKPRSRKGRRPAPEKVNISVVHRRPMKKPLLKVPKLPMVRQGKERWYRAKLVKETEEKILVGKYVNSNHTQSKTDLTNF